jgi:hypothetical protein
MVELQGSGESLPRSARAGNNGACGRRVPPCRRCNVASTFYFQMVVWVKIQNWLAGLGNDNVSTFLEALLLNSILWHLCWMIVTLDTKCWITFLWIYGSHHITKCDDLSLELLSLMSCLLEVAKQDVFWWHCDCEVGAAAVWVCSGAW